MIHPRELEKPLFAWALFAGGAILLGRYLAIELIEAISACVLKLIELCETVRARRSASS